MKKNEVDDGCLNSIKYKICMHLHMIFIGACGSFNHVVGWW